MLFSVYDDKNILVMTTNSKKCIPDETQLSNMSSNGYKFKINGKIISLKKLKDFISEVSE